MKRSRIFILACFLLALLVIPAAWKLAGADDVGDKASAEQYRSAGAASTTSSTVGSEPGKSSQRAETLDYAARAKSMLELRPGELGVLPLPAGFLDEMQMPGDPVVPPSVPLLKGVMGKASAQKMLERALRQGSPIQAKVGMGSDGVGWKGGKLDLSARLNQLEDPIPELSVEASADGEASTMSLQVSPGACAVVRYPSGESVLLVIGGTSVPDGAVSKEK